MPKTHNLAALRLADDLDELPCREKEVKTISSFISNSLTTWDGSSHLLFISGLPGTGKTVSVKMALRNLEAQKKCPPFNHLISNALRLATPAHLFVEMHELITGKHGKPISTESAFVNVDNHFRKRSTKKPNIVFVCDEFETWIADANKMSRQLYSLCEWPRLKQSKLIIIFISNSFNIPDSLVTQCGSRIAFNQLQMPSYSFGDMEKILLSRIKYSSADFEDGAVQLIARKVANYSGDLRVALEVCTILAEQHKGKTVEVITVGEYFKHNKPPSVVSTTSPIPMQLFSICLVIQSLGRAKQALESNLDNKEPVYLNWLLGKFRDFINIFYKIESDVCIEDVFFSLVIYFRDSGCIILSHSLNQSQPAPFFDLACEVVVPHETIIHGLREYPTRITFLTELDQIDDLVGAIQDLTAECD